MFLSELAEVSGRLQHVHLETRSVDVASDSGLLITRFEIPQERAIEAELGVARAGLGGFVAGAGGQYVHGDQWMVLLQQVPPRAEKAALSIRDDALARADVRRIDGEFWASEGIVRTYFAARAATAQVENSDVSPSQEPPAASSIRQLQRLAQTVSFSSLAQLLCVELTNFPLEKALVGFPLACGFPDRDHYCKGDVLSDIMNGWLDLNGQPWPQ